MASSLEVTFAGQTMLLDAALGLFWPAQSTLIVSDLHLEKGTSYAQFGSAVAPYDALDTLVRLDKLVCRYTPRRLVMLGDSFHDKQAWERLPDGAQRHLVNICNSVDEAVFVEGNHDVGVKVHPCLQFADEITLGGVVLRHEPEASDAPQIIGHFHPKAGANLRGFRLRGKCFAKTNNLLVMPAFGSFTGGLDIRDEVFTDLSGGADWQAYLVYKSTIAALK